MKKLELIAVPVLCNGDMLLRHFRSIDVPLKRYFILDNSCGTDDSVEKAIDTIWDTKPDHIDDVVILTSTQNTGYAGAVNLIIRQNFDCPYWIISNFDVQYAPGELHRLLHSIEELPDGAFCGTPGTDEFVTSLFTPSLLKKVGYLDENFYPAYFDDNDYRWRCQLAAAEPINFRLKYKHDTSTTINSSPHYKQANGRTFQQNYQYYLEKWGGPPNGEVFVTPFNKKLPVDYWEYQPVRNNTLRWI